MIRARHPDVAAQILRASPTWQAAESAARSLLVGVEGFQRTPDREPDDFEPGGVRHGWQREAASRIERQFRGRLNASFS